MMDKNINDEHDDDDNEKLIASYIHCTYIDEPLRLTVTGKR
ncbi:MAG: hypothetical protein ABSF20_01745 [Smithella sp.]|jgi:hypothetical protein